MNKDYIYFQGESICPGDDFVSPLKSVFWEREAYYYANEKELEKEYPTPLDYVKRYCAAIADKWYTGSGYTIDDIFNDYKERDKNTLKSS